MNIPSIQSAGGRRAWAFAALVGGAMVFTVFAAFGVWVLRDNPGFAFWLALAAHGQIFVALTSLGGLLVRRSIKATKDGVEYEDLASVKDIQ